MNTQSFWLPEHRIGIALSQIPLRIGIYLELGLPSLITIYSLSFIVEYAVIAFICYQLLKVKEASLIIALSLIIGVAHSFFHPVTETYHALVITTLVYSFLVSPITQKLSPFYYYPLLFLICAWALVCHPISVFILGFITLYTFSLQKINLKTTVFLFSLPIIASALRLLYSPSNSYDTQQYATLFTYLKDITHVHQFYPFQFITNRLKSTYLPASLILLALCASLVYLKHYRELGFVLLASAAYSVIGILTFANGDADIMMEKTFLPGIYMLIVPFCYTFINRSQVKLLNYALLGCASIAAIVSFRNIIKASHPYTERIEILTSTMGKQASPKIIANYSDFNEDKIKFNHWNTGIDAFILSKCLMDSPKTIFMTDDKTSFSYDSTDLHLFLGPTWWANWNSQTFDSTYFYFPPSTYTQFHSGSTTK